MEAIICNNIFFNLALQGLGDPNNYVGIRGDGAQKKCGKNI